MGVSLDVGSIPILCPDEQLNLIPTSVVGYGQPLSSKATCPNMRTQATQLYLSQVAHQPTYNLPDGKRLPERDHKTAFRGCGPVRKATIT